MVRSTRAASPSTRRPVPSEASIQRAIIDWLSAQRWRVMRQNSGALPNEHGRPVRFGEPGLPDLLALKNGRYLWIEVKRPGNTPTALQQQKHAELRHYGATVVVATCIEDVAVALAEGGFYAA